MWNSIIEVKWCMLVSHLLEKSISPITVDYSPILANFLIPSRFRSMKTRPFHKICSIQIYCTLLNSTFYIVVELTVSLHVYACVCGVIILRKERAFSLWKNPSSKILPISVKNILIVGGAFSLQTRVIFGKSQQLPARLSPLNSFFFGVPRSSGSVQRALTRDTVATRGWGKIHEKRAVYERVKLTAASRRLFAAATHILLALSAGKHERGASINHRGNCVTNDPSSDNGWEVRSRETREIHTIHYYARLTSPTDGMTKSRDDQTHAENSRRF